jgi:glycosyltransferase involved in cell wall biosynthesis
MPHKYQIKYVYERYSHHSRFSGTEQIINRLGNAIPIPDFRKRWKRIVPLRIVNRLVGSNCGALNYNYPQFYHELSAGIDLLQNRNTIYHILDGERSYRYLGLLRGWRNNKIIATFHQPYTEFNRVIHNTRYLEKLDGITVTSSTLLPIFSDIVDPSRLFFIPFGVDIEWFVPLQKNIFLENPKKQYGLFVGDWLRNFQLLSDSIQIIESKKLPVEFVVVTPRKNHSYFNGLKSVILYDRVSEEALLSAYQNASFFIHPLIDGAYNQSLLEAMACGLPIVATDNGGTRDYITEDSCILVDSGSPLNMAEAINNLVTDTSLNIKMGTASRKIAESFSWARTCDLMKVVYRTIMDI